MRGRKPIPTQLKIIRGNPGKRALSDDEPSPPEGEIKCPSWLKGRARRIWKEMVPVLMEMRVLTTADVPMFASLCETQAEFIDAREDIRKRGIEIAHTRYTKDGHAYEEYEDNPSVKIASDAGKRAKALMVEFGLSPSSRTRVKVEPKPKAKSPLELIRERQQQA